MNFRVALVQKAARPNAPAANLRLALDTVEQAARLGADLVLFPELWSHGYAPPFPGAFNAPFDPRFEQERAAWLKSALPRQGAYLNALRAAAQKHRIAVVATLLAQTGGKPQNAALLLGRSGEILLDYAKVHTCDFSLEALMQAGCEFKVCGLDGIKLGVMICYDREFPESARVLMLKGAELILVPNACPMDPARLGQLAARAFENMVGVAMANYPGPGWGQSCAVSPMVYGPQGYTDPTLLLAPQTAEGLFVAEFDMDAIHAYRSRESWGNAYRKPAAYAPLLETRVEPPFVRPPLANQEETP